MSRVELPELAWDSWGPTRATFHRVCQVVGKVRLRLHPKKNHWWHVPLYLSSHGLTTRPIPLPGGDALELELDLRAGVLVARRALGEEITLPVSGRSVAEIHDDLFGALDRLAVKVEIVGRPFDLDDETPFALDRAHASWDADALERARRMLLWSAGVFESFAGRFVGKQTPVHVFWHSLDLALTRFNGRRGPPMPDADPVSREGYSHELVSFGFWFGDPWTPEPSYYAYAYPEPPTLVEAPLPPPARWENPRGRGHLALLAYDDVRRAEAPDELLLSFLEGAYRAMVERAPGWDAEALRTPWAV
jgi:hypothetical protein